MLTPGTRVQIVGLSSRPDLNGARGIILDFDEAKGRHAVKVAEDGHPMAIKPVNLVQMQKPISKRAAQDVGASIAKGGWQQAHAASLERLEQHALLRPALCNPKMVSPMDVLRAWHASLGSVAGTHIWALACLAALLQTVANVRGDPALLDGVELTPRGLQALFERAWAAGYGDGAFFQGKLAGKEGHPAHTGPADFLEVLTFLGIDAWASTSSPSSSSSPSAATTNSVARPRRPAPSSVGRAARAWRR
jgi:hypothetical protein